MEKWIDVKEKLPEKHDLYLVHYSRYNYIDNEIDNFMDTCWGGEDNPFPEGVAHWMPLPEPPRQ